ncbi:glycoside hydrolase family 3 protein [Streptomyces sp. SP18CS02]|uniref:glycoside hydrolase family 3 protein n=1 Tax=Streptomyces sp. SP18CS02 TaxID=3002531 RepID=UPI002E759F96|nr:glycoside hydrolase family 3 N-terminal domain-containing protein [Streptomyces sp. SP18CS02]MEE1752022.1 glycoside hydrolase family 3 N-terminal domain-containing protein [Streptomyces sp. SP18CS02]
MSTVVSLVNSCLLASYEGRVPPPWIRRAVEDGLAGVGVFGTNLAAPAPGARTPAPVPYGTLHDDIVAPLRAVRPDVLIALDEEGGDVTRLDYHRGSPYPGNHALGAVDDPGLTRRVASAIGADLVDAGINLCLGPCADVNSQPDNPIIGVRSFGADPELVARHTEAFVRGLQDSGAAATLKHFPGHGDTGIDSHTALPDVDRDLPALRALDLPPFVAGIAAGAKAVMTGHIRLPRLAEPPATLSPRIVTGLLRGELGYEGVIISDALEMAPILGRYGFGGAAVLAWSAGVDLVLLGASGVEHTLPEVYKAVEAALRKGELTIDRLEEAAARVDALRTWALPVAPGVSRHPGIGLVAARRAVSSVGVHPFGPAAPVHTVRLMSAANMAVGVAPWGLARALEGLDRLASSVDVDPGTDPAEIPLPAVGPLAVVVRDAAGDPWQHAAVEALRARRPDLVTVDMGLAPAPGRLTSPLLLTRGAGLANAIAAAEFLTGRGWSAPLSER